MTGLYVFCRSGGSPWWRHSRPDWCSLNAGVTAAPYTSWVGAQTRPGGAARVRQANGFGGSVRTLWLLR